MSRNTKSIKKLSDLNSIHGKVESDTPTTLDQIVGKSLSKYKTDNFEEYMAGLASYNIAELRSHALTLGAFVPNSDRNKLIKQLEREFQKYHAVYKKPAHTDSNITLSETAEGRKKLNAALKIMSALK